LRCALPHAAVVVVCSAEPRLRKCQERGAAVLLAGELTRERTTGNIVAVDGGLYARRFDEQRKHLVLAGGRLILGHLHDERRAELIPRQRHLADRTAEPFGMDGAPVAGGHEIPPGLKAAALQIAGG